MTTTIVLPTNPIFDIYCKNKDEVEARYGTRIIRLPEKDCISTMLYNRADAAFLSPLGYGLGLGRADYRIVEGPALGLLGYTKTASIYFKEGLVTLASAMSDEPDDFIMLMANLLLREMYDIELDLKKNTEGIDKILGVADAAILWGNKQEIPNSLDISDEWFEFFNYQLPLGFWVCRNEEHPIAIKEIITDLIGPAFTLEDDILEELPLDKDLLPRQGRILRKWDDDMEQALEQTISLLYYHQFLSEIPAIKILGRDDSEIIVK